MRVIWDVKAGKDSTITPRIPRCLRF